MRSLIAGLVLVASLATGPLVAAHADPACQAAPAPAVGQVIPCAVQTPAGQPAYVYAYGYQPGQAQGPGGGSLASVLQQEIAAGAITRQQAARSWDATPATIRGGGANPFS